MSSADTKRAIEATMKAVDDGLLVGTAKQGKVEISRAAMMARVNRHLGKGDWPKKVIRTKPTWAAERGAYMVVELDRNLVVDSFDDLELYARKIDVIAKWEALEAD